MEQLLTKGELDKDNPLCPSNGKERITRFKAFPAEFSPRDPQY